jgi:hypothetical protein
MFSETSVDYEREAGSKAVLVTFSWLFYSSTLSIVAKFPPEIWCRLSTD